MLVAIFGIMGSGKTLIMTILGSALSDSGLPIYSNYQLKDSLPIKSVGELLGLESGIVCLDEFWVSMDSRLWKDNVFLTRWINQTRKKNLLVFYTTQSFGQIDIRVRQATDLLIFCEKFVKKGYFRYTFLSGTSKSMLKSFKIPIEKAKNFFEYYDSFKLIFPLIAKRR